MKNRIYNIENLIVESNGIRDDKGTIINLPSRATLIKSEKDKKFFAIEILGMHKVIEISIEKVHIRNH